MAAIPHPNRPAATEKAPCQHAVALAVSGDTIEIAAAIYTETFTIGENLNILGASASTTVIDGGGVSRVVTTSNATAHVTLSKLTIRNGRGGINNSGTLTGLWFPKMSSRSNGLRINNIQVELPWLGRSRSRGV